MIFCTNFGKISSNLPFLKHFNAITTKNIFSDRYKTNLQPFNTSELKHKTKNNFSNPGMSVQNFVSCRFFLFWTPSQKAHGS